MQGKPLKERSVNLTPSSQEKITGLHIGSSLTAAPTHKSVAARELAQILDQRRQRLDELDREQCILREQELKAIESKAESTRTKSEVKLSPFGKRKQFVAGPVSFNVSMEEEKCAKSEGLPLRKEVQWRGMEERLAYLLITDSVKSAQSQKFENGNAN